VALSNDGDTIAIGAPFANSFEGRVRVYRHDGSDWAQLGGDVALSAADVYLEVSGKWCGKQFRKRYCV
jgi:hypothetical protein